MQFFPSQVSPTLMLTTFHLNILISLLQLSTITRENKFKMFDKKDIEDIVKDIK